MPTFAYEFNDENAPGALPAPGQLRLRRGPRVRDPVPDGPADGRFPGALSASQQQLATIMKGYWTNFARNGFPSSFGAPFWPLFNGLTQAMESLTPPAPQLETNFASVHNCVFWTALEAAAT